MNSLKHWPLIAFVFVFAGCNEKVSPELQDSNSSTTVAPNGGSAPDSYFFKLTNNSSVMLNYKLHKTGANNASTPCQISSANALSSAYFSSTGTSNAAVDISCFLEAEELSLYFGGFNLQLEASKNTCDYVAYMPYGYYNWMPGDSSTSVEKVECTGASPATVKALAIAQGSYWPSKSNGGGGTQTINCGEYVDATITAAERTNIPLTAESDLCRFNHTASDGPNCDSGKIQVCTIANNYIAASGTTPAYVEQVQTCGYQTCGGQTVNCVNGPVKDSIKGTLAAKTITYYQPEYNVDYKRAFDFPDLVTKKVHSGGTRYYANFRRNLSSLYIDFQDTLDTGVYRANFGGTYQSDFNPIIMTNYAQNFTPEGSSLSRVVPSSVHDSHSYYYADKNVTPHIKYQKVRPLAAEPFLGLALPVNPFYTFYCLDRARDIKARIRLVVRDWDKIFHPDSVRIEKISDLNTLDPVQDVEGRELSNDTSGVGDWNDYQDWDDLIPMRRTPFGNAYSSATRWAISPTSGPFTPNDLTDPLNPVPTTGWFNPLYFPGNYD